MYSDLECRFNCPPWRALVSLIIFFISVGIQNHRAFAQNSGQTFEEITISNTDYVHKGLPTHAFPDVGALLLRGNGELSHFICTATLIAPNAALTAAHCFQERNLDISLYSLFFHRAGPVSATAVAFPSRRAFHNQPLHGMVDDIAIIKLERALWEMPPRAIGWESPSDQGTLAHVVGYGMAFEPETRGLDFGLKRVGAVHLAPCAVPGAERAFICWQFSILVGQSIQLANSCQIDSGGPVMAGLNSSVLIGTVAHNTIGTPCDRPGLNWNERLSAHRPFVEATLQTFAIPPATPVSQFYEETSHPCPLTQAAPEDTHSISITERDNLSRLRIALSGYATQAAGGLDLKVWNEKGEPADCVRRLGETILYCEILKPNPGQWKTLISATGKSDAKASWKAGAQVVFSFYK